jgi:hypothetical protein
MQGNGGLQQMARSGQNQQHQGGNRNFQDRNNGNYNKRPQGNNSRGPMNNMGGQDQMQQMQPRGGNQGQRNMQQNAVELPGARNTQAAPMMAQSQDPAAVAFYQKTAKIVPSLKADNPHLKQSVGNAIFDFVTQLKGSELAPKITGMLIDLPLNETQTFMTNYGEFRQKVEEAATLLIRTSGGQPMPPTPGMGAMPGMNMPMPGMPGMPSMPNANFP